MCLNNLNNEVPLLFVSVLLFASEIAAQAIDLPETVVHYYVDPNYGEDIQPNANGATDDLGIVQNPGGVGSTGLGAWTCGGTFTPQFAPEVLDASSNQLLHAAWPYRTITSAVRSIPSLPYSSTVQVGAGVDLLVHWTHAIVHLLPGMYGRNGAWKYGSSPLSEQFHPDNGLRYNGETFPVRVPTHVSIQGASALNTVIDLIGDSANVDYNAALNRKGPAFEFGVYTTNRFSTNQIPCDGIDSFIDSVSIYGVSGSWTGSPPPNAIFDSGTAILVNDQISSSPTISNCMLFRNAVGVGIKAAYEGVAKHYVEPAVVHHGTKLINNTFVWNEVAIWNGQTLRDWVAQANNNTGIKPYGHGWSKLILVNNILDIYATGANYTGSSNSYNGAKSTFTRCGHTPHWAVVGTSAGSSSFEGVHANDLHTQVSTGVFRNFNAYEYVGVGTGKPYNNIGVLIPRFSNTAPRPTATTLPYVPTLNLAAFTGFTSNQGSWATSERGVLYVSDLICNGRSWTPPSGIPQPFAPGGIAATRDFDGSFMDFRLSPSMTLATPRFANSYVPNDNTGTPTHAVTSILVDSGYAATPIIQANGLTTNQPGAITTTGPWSFHNWRWDCEGYGNPRIHDHALSYANSGVGSAGEFIDIGADELGELIVAGYRVGTTDFLKMPKDHFGTGKPAKVMDNQYSWYIGPPWVAANNGANLGGVSAIANVRLPQCRVFDKASILIPFLKTVPKNYEFSTGPTTKGSPWYSASATAVPGYRSWTLSSVRAYATAALRLSVYQPTLANITPHLLPDVHPFHFMTLGSTTTFPFPSNPVWQPCSPLVNTSLFLNPTENRINPPGTLAGGQTSDQKLYNYLDVSLVAGVGSVGSGSMVPWFFFPAGPTSIAIFDAWCRGGTGGASPNVDTTLPSTIDDHSTNKEYLYLRANLEQGAGFTGTAQNGGTFGGALADNNLQSFGIYIKK